MSRRPKEFYSDVVEYNLWEDPLYLYEMKKLTSDNLKLGNNVINEYNGDIIITETKIYHTLYSWNKEKRKLEKREKKCV